MAQLAASRVPPEPVRRVHRRAVDDPFDQRQELHRSRPHPLEIRDAIIEAVAPRVLDQDIDETDDPGDRRGEFLTYKGGNRLVETTGWAGAAHRHLPKRASARHAGAAEQGLDL